MSGHSLTRAVRHQPFTTRHADTLSTLFRQFNQQEGRHVHILTLDDLDSATMGSHTVAQATGECRRCRSRSGVLVDTTNGKPIAGVKAAWAEILRLRKAGAQTSQPAAAEPEGAGCRSRPHVRVMINRP